MHMCVYMHTHVCICMLDIYTHILFHSLATIMKVWRLKLSATSKLFTKNWENDVFLKKYQNLVFS